MDQTQNEFLAEIAERIEQLFVSIDELRRKLANGPQSRELLDRIFRDTHTIKGSAAAIGLKALSKEAHALENRLESVREGDTTLDEQLLDSFEEAAQALLDSLKSSALKAPAQSIEQIVDSLPAGLRESVGKFEKSRLAAAYREGASIYVVSASYEFDQFDVQLRSLQQRLKRHGEIIATSPAITGDRNRIGFEILFPSQVDLAKLIEDLDGPAGISISKVAQQAHAATLPPKEAKLANVIQVNLKDLDRLSSSAHKLLAQATSTIQLAPHEATDREASIASVRQSFMRLEEEIIQLRTVSLERALQRAVRAGRMVARASGKDVAFEVSGGKARLDKVMANAIADSLIHLIRNAVDHGIGTGPERVLLGKNLQGRVRIEVVSESGQTLVRVSDDGRGIDPLIISRAAAELGIIPQGATLTLERSLRLIFRSGFSTAALASNVSGRGVGLDVVETVIEHAGGEVRVSSEVGVGTTFELRLPVTSGLLNSQIVKSAEHHYCLDSNVVRRCIQTSSDKVSGPTFRVEEEMLPIFHLRNLLGQSAIERDGAELSVLLCEFHEPEEPQRLPKRIVLVVDRVVESQQILVRGLGPHGGRWHGISGATELIDGTVALVLDLPRLIELMPSPSSDASSAT